MHAQNGDVCGVLMLINLWDMSDFYLNFYEEIFCNCKFIHEIMKLLLLEIIQLYDKIVQVDNF